MKAKRLSWEDYFMGIAGLVAQRSTCLRRQVGCVIVREKRILATGYNGAPSNVRHCEDVGCMRQKQNIPSGQRQELCRGLHAEQNAIIQAALTGTSIKNSIVYCTHQSCVVCAKMLINSGVEKIIYQGDYPDKLAVQLLKEAGIKLQRKAK